MWKSTREALKKVAHKHLSFLHLYIVLTFRFPFLITSFLRFNSIPRRIVNNNWLIPGTNILHSQNPPFALSLVFYEDIFSGSFTGDPDRNFNVSLSDAIGRRQELLC